MNIDIERLKRDRAYWDAVAPEGATHYSGDLAHPWLMESPASYFTDYENWVAYRSESNAIVHFAHAFPRPEPATEWDGEGLPPVGCECELDDPALGDWNRCAIKWIGREIVVVDRPEGGEYCVLKQAQNFRPIRSKSERDKERLERLIQNALRECHYSASDEDVSRKISGAILAAGWQKPE